MAGQACRTPQGSCVCRDIVYFSSHHNNRRLNPTYANVLESFNDHSVTRVPQQMVEEKGEKNKMTNTEEIKKEGKKTK